MENSHYNPNLGNFEQNSPELSANLNSKSNSNQPTKVQCHFPECGKTFRYESELKKHLVTHDKAKPYECTHPQCGKKFKRKGAFKVHMQTHSEEAQFSCSIPGCDAQFKTNYALKYHLNRHHASDTQPSNPSPEALCKENNRENEGVPERRTFPEDVERFIGNNFIHNLETDQYEMNQMNYWRESQKFFQQQDIRDGLKKLLYEKEPQSYFSLLAQEFLEWKKTYSMEALYKEAKLQNQELLEKLRGYHVIINESISFDKPLALHLKPPPADLDAPPQ